MRILGIDPGLSNTGYGIIDHEANQSRLVAQGCIITKSSEATALRLKAIYDGLTNVIAETRPDAVALEKLFFSVNVRSAMAVGEGRGVAILATATANLPMAEYTPQEIKQAVSGSGKAGKDQVLRMVSVILALKESPATSHAADALAVAICHAHSSHFKLAVENSMAKQLLMQAKSRRRRTVR
jgi:crossover junction endodeoxyribonuclease RuvC